MALSNTAYGELLEKYGFEPDEEEKTRGMKPITIYTHPKPARKVHLVSQNFNQSIEEAYFWLLTSLRDDWGMHEVEKITDIFTASEQSAFWGASQQRLQIQQSQVQNYLATIGKLIKDLFQLVREMSILNERLALYKSTKKYLRGHVRRRKHSIPEEIVLKGYWVDMKDGGVKSPGSVYGLSSSLGYTTLPDLFFAAPPMKKDEITEYVEKLGFNKRLQDVLKKKLAAYTYWKEFTQKQLETRHEFTIKYLRQHYQSIRLYMNWVKPYLKNVKRLQMNESRSVSEDLIGSFEGSFVEIEILATKEGEGDHKPVVILTMEFRTQPHMDYHQDGYQHKGPVHVGRTEFWLRGYAWTQKEIDNYKKFREAESFDMLGDIDSSLKGAIDSLGDELKAYLLGEKEKFPDDLLKEEEEKKAKKEKERKEKEEGALEPFKALFGGFKEIFQTVIPEKEKKEKGKISEHAAKENISKVKKEMELRMFNTYKNFKKAHKMLSW